MAFIPENNAFTRSAKESLAKKSFPLSARAVSLSAEVLLFAVGVASANEVILCANKLNCIKTSGSNNRSSKYKKLSIFPRFIQ